MIVKDKDNDNDKDKDLIEDDHHVADVVAIGVKTVRVGSSVQFE